MRRRFNTLGAVLAHTHNHHDIPSSPHGMSLKGSIILKVQEGLVKHFLLGTELPFFEDPYKQARIQRRFGQNRFMYMKGLRI